MNEKPLLRTGSSSGPMAGPMAGHEGDIDKAIESLEREGIAAKQKAQKLIELEHAKEIYKQQLVKGAAIVTGQVNTSGNGEIVASSTEQEKDKAKQIQYATGAVSSVLGLLWITYAGTDAPAEVYAAVPLVVGLVGQAIATHINNRKAK